MVGTVTDGQSLIAALLSPLERLRYHPVLPNLGWFVVWLVTQPECTTEE